MQPVYFDHNATTALDPRVLGVMLPCLQQRHGNPTSRHAYGRRAREAVEQARAQVAMAVGAHPSQVIFTSGGTEADNLAILGIAARLMPGRVAVSAVEHPAVLRPAQALRTRGWQYREVGVDHAGVLHAEALESGDTLVSVMAANNETGVLQNIPAIAERVRRYGGVLHTDAVQALGKVALDFYALGVHAMSLSSHKINGPQGAGALIVDKRIDLQPVLHGGGQERGLRSGTENIAAIVGFGMACELAAQELGNRARTTQLLRDRLEHGLQSLGATIFGQAAPRLPNTTFFAFPQLDGETLVMALDRQGFAVASGSACSSDSPEPSHVLLAMGVPQELARGAVRISLGADNTIAQVDACLRAVAHELSRIRRMAAIAV